MEEVFTIVPEDIVRRLCSSGPLSSNLLDRLERAIERNSQEIYNEASSHQLRMLSETIWYALVRMQIQNPLQNRLNLLASRLWSMGNQQLDNDDTLASSSELLFKLKTSLQGSDIHDSLLSWSSFAHTSVSHHLGLLLRDDKIPHEKKVSILREMGQIHLNASARSLSALVEAQTTLGSESLQLELASLIQSLTSTSQHLQQLSESEPNLQDLELQILRVLFSSLIFKHEHDKQGDKEGLLLIHELGTSFLSRSLDQPLDIWLFTVKARVLGDHLVDPDVSNSLCLQLLREIDEVISNHGCGDVTYSALSLVVKAESGSWIEETTTRQGICSLIIKAVQKSEEGGQLVLIAVEAFTSRATALLNQSQEEDDGSLYLDKAEGMLRSINSLLSLPLISQPLRFSPSSSLMLHRWLHQMGSSLFSMSLYSTAKDMFSHGLHFCPRYSNQLMNSTLRMLAASCLEEGHYSEALGHLKKLMTLNNEEWVEDDDQGGVEKARTLSLRITILLRAAAQSENNESHMRAAMIDLSSMEAIRVRLPSNTFIHALLMEIYHQSISSSPLFASEVVQVLRKEVQNLSYEEILGNALLGFDARMRRDNIQLALDELVWGCRTIAQLPLEDLRKGGKKDSKPLSALINAAVDIGSRASRQFQWKEAHGAFAVCLFLHDLGPPCNATWSRSALTACASFSLIRWHILLQSKRSADVCYEPLSAEGGRFFIKPAPSFPTSRSLLDISLELLNRSDLAFSSDLCSCRFMTLTLLNDGEGQKRVVKSLLCHQNLELLTSLAVFCLVHQSEPSMGQALLAHVIRMSKEGGSMLMAVRAARILLQKPTLSTPAVEVVTAAVSHLLVRMEAKCGESEAERKWLEARIADKKSSMILEAESQSREREVVTGTP